jgi:dephospho-CoA kinase
VLENKLIIGLTGLYSSGKSSIANIFEKSGYHVIEADHVGHTALSKKRDSVLDRFGLSILDIYGNIDRKKLATIVFNDTELLEDLEAIVHPFIVEEIKRIIASNNSKRFLINAAILHKLGLDLLCHKVIYVSADEEKIINWAIKRSNLTRDSINRRLKSQNTVKLSKGHSDYHIINDGTINELAKKAKDLVKTIKGL